MRRAPVLSRRSLRWIAATFAAALAAPQAAAVAGDGVAVVGHPAPRFVVETATGDEVTRASLAGRPAVLNVFASWCPPCREELPRIAAAARLSRGRVRFVGVDAQEPVQIAVAFAKQMQIPYEIVFDHGQFAASYGATSLPETIFIDKAGSIRAIVHGVISERELKRDLQLLGSVPSVAGR